MSFKNNKINKDMETLSDVSMFSNKESVLDPNDLQGLENIVAFRITQARLVFFN